MHWSPIAAGVIAFVVLVWKFWDPLTKIPKAWWETREAKLKYEHSKLALSYAQKQREEEETEDDMLAYKERASMGRATIVIIADEMYVQALPNRNPETIRKILRRWRHERSNVASSGRFSGRFS
jgi:hypothetical protein